MRSGRRDATAAQHARTPLARTPLARTPLAGAPVCERRGEPLRAWLVAHWRYDVAAARSVV